MDMTLMMSALTENFPLVVIAVVVIVLSSTNLTPVPRILTAFFSRLYLRTVIAGRQHVAANAEEVSGTVSRLFFHPVKSLKAVSCDSIKLDTKGFANDRNIMIVAPISLPVYKKAWDADDVTYRFMSQRQCPTLATVTAKLDADTNKLTLSSPLLKDNNNSVTVSTSPSLDAPVYRSKLWDDDVLVHDLGDEAAAFIQQIFNQDKTIEAGVSGTDKVRLVLQSPIDNRLANDKYTPASARTILGHAPPVSLSDGFPILIACETSLIELNRRIQAKGGGRDAALLPMSRFRPNIVISGTKVPFEEDRWKVISINGVLFHIVKGCPRCKQSCTDQTTGVVHDEPLATLSEFRAMTSKHQDNLYFATNAIPAVGSNGKTISVGAKVQVLQWGTPQWDE